MRIEATVSELRALLQLAEFDAEAAELPLEAYRSRRESRRGHVARALLQRYERLIEAGRSPAIVALERGACGGCHLRLPTMVESQARRSTAVHACPHCRRMLYAPERLAESDAGRPAPRRKASKRRTSPASAPGRS